MIEILFFLVMVLLVLFYKFFKLKIEFHRLVTETAKKLFNEWKKLELENEKKRISELLQRELEIKFNKWVEEAREKISKEAIEKSTSVILGKVGEQLAPIFIFQKYGINPKDLRFLGTPIDYIAFEGLHQQNLKRITFIEIKSGKVSSLTPLETQVRDIIEKKKIGWIQINLKEELNEIYKKLQE